jgi:hypothetical protein
MMDNVAYQPWRGNWILHEVGAGPAVGRNNDLCLAWTTAEDLARKLVAWTHPGFSSHIGEAIRFENKKAIEDLAYYLVRAPLSLQKLVYLDGQQAVRYRSRMNPSLGRSASSGRTKRRGATQTTRSRRPGAARRPAGPASWPRCFRWIRSSADAAGRPSRWRPTSPTRWRSGGSWTTRPWRFYWTPQTLPLISPFQRP